MEVLSLQSFKESFQCVLLVEVYIGVPIHRLYVDNHVLNNSNSSTIPQELLVGRFCVILLCLDELMVKVQVIEFSLCQSSCSQQGVDKQIVNPLGDIEFINLAGLRYRKYCFETIPLWLLG